MANITAKDVAELRKRTGIGMMECKKALVEADGDLDAAIKILREKGELKAESKMATRIAADGVVAIAKEGDVTAMIEVNSETDFVAKNESFKEFVTELLKLIVAQKPADIDALMACKYDDEMTVDGKVKEMIFKIGEKITVRRFVLVEGVTSTYIHGTGSIGVIAKFNTNVADKAEFAAFAKNESFKEFVGELLKIIIAQKPADVDALMACTYDSEMNVDAKVKEMIFKIGEKITVRRFVLVEGVTSTYIHGTGSIGVIAKFDTDVADKPEFVAFAKNIALQIGAYPTPYLCREQVPASVIEEEKNILLAQIANDPANAKKPDAIKEKMVIGRISKFYDNNCLVDMTYVKDEDMKVGKYVEVTAKELGGSIKIADFYRYEKGEGIQKREENFADEIAKMTAGK